MESTTPHSITMDSSMDQSMFSNNHQYGGDDDRSMGSHRTNQSSIGMASSAAKPHTSNENFMKNDQFNAVAQGGSDNTGSNATIETEEDALTAETENAVTKERQMLYKENAAKLQSILENIKNSTKSILREMDTYLGETEDVEKTFIRCRAKTQKESQRMEQVEPDVLAATQRFMAQGAQMFGAAGGGSMDFMNMAALMGANGGNAGASMGMPGNRGNGQAFMGMSAPAVTPRGSDAASMAGSSMAGSMS